MPSAHLDHEQLQHFMNSQHLQLARKILRLRVSNAMTQAQAAKIAGVSLQEFGQMESGYVGIASDRYKQAYKAMADFFQVKARPAHARDPFEALVNQTHRNETNTIYSNSFQSPSLEMNDVADYPVVTDEFLAEAPIQVSPASQTTNWPMSATHLLEVMAFEINHESEISLGEYTFA